MSMSVISNSVIAISVISFSVISNSLHPSKVRGEALYEMTSSEDSRGNSVARDVGEEEV